MHNHTLPPTTGDRLLTPRQLAAAYPAFSIGSIRWLLFRRETNGLESAVRYAGRKLIVSEQRFLAWLDGEQPRGASDQERT